jgi:hypothetical protein
MGKSLLKYLVTEPENTLKRSYTLVSFQENKDGTIYANQ